MGILGNLFGGEDNDWGTRLALMGQVLMAADQGQVANIAPSIAALNERRRKIADEMKTTKWMQNQAAAMADKNPRLAAMLQDAPPEIGQSLLSQYYQTLLQPPDWKTFESGGDIYRYNPLDQNSKPEMFFDGPDDPFKALLKSVVPGSRGMPPEVPVPGAAPTPGEPDDTSMPTAEAAAPAGGDMTPQMKLVAETFGLPPDATAADVMAVANAGIVGGPDQARQTAEAISKRYADAKSQGVDLTQKQVESAFKLQDDYWRVGQNYQKIMDTATEIAALPDDANGFERLMTLYKFMRTLDPAGAVRESDAAMAQNADNIISKIDQIAQKYTGMSGGDIPAGAAGEMKRLILELGEASSKADYKTRRKVLKRAKAMGIPEDKAEAMIFGSLQDAPEDMDGYQPRFSPGSRKSDTEMATGVDAVDGPAQAPAGTPQVKTIEDYNKLEPGTVYIDPNGLVKTKGGTK